jgi:ATP-dependent Clp protease adaptor protein ClpS
VPRQEDTATIERVKTERKTVEPDYFRVLLINDDFTPMDFVVMVLVNVFDKDANQAEQIMLDVHQKGVGVAGIYVEDVALSKVAIVDRIVAQTTFPFKLKIEKEQ